MSAVELVRVPSFAESAGKNVEQISDISGGIGGEHWSGALAHSHRLTEAKNTPSAAAFQLVPCTTFSGLKNPNDKDNNNNNHSHINNQNDNNGNQVGPTPPRPPRHSALGNGSPKVLVATRRVEPPRAPADCDSVIELESSRCHEAGAQAEIKAADSPTTTGRSGSVPSKQEKQQQDPQVQIITVSSEKPSGACAAQSEERMSRQGDKSSLATTGPAESKNPKKRKEQRGIRKAPFMFAGIFGSILGSVFFSLSMLCIKLLPDSEGLSEKSKIVSCRGLIITVLCGVSIIYQRSTFKIPRDEIWVNILRSVFGFLGVYGAYVSLKYISIGDSTALVFSSPVWTSLLSHFILNEPIRWIQLLALPVSMFGIVLIAHPALIIDMDQVAGPIERQPEIHLEANSSQTAETNTSSLLLNADLDISMNSHELLDLDHRWPGIVIALLTSLIVSCVYIVLKFRKSTPILTTTFWLGVLTLVAGLLIQLFIGFGSWPGSLSEWLLLFANGFFSWLGQCTLQWSLYYEDASVLSVVRTLDVAMTFSLSALFLDEQILWTSIVGAAIIASVVVSIMLNNWIASKMCPSSSQVHAAESDEHEQESGRCSLGAADATGATIYTKPASKVGAAA